jgi:hypothetical protein
MSSGIGGYMNEVPNELRQELVIAAEAKLTAKLERLKSRTLLFGLPGSYSWCQSAALTSNVNLSEFTTIILDNGLSFSQLGTSLNSYSFSLVLNRLTTIDDWTGRGHTLIVVLRNIGKIIREGIPHEIHQFPVFNGINYDETSGTQIEYCGPPMAEEFFTRWIKLLRYDLIISAPKLKPLLRVHRWSSGPTEVVGGILKKGAGQIIFVPKPVAGPGTDEHLRYLADLAGCPELIQEPLAELPGWATNFQTAEEVRARDNIDALRSQISRIENTVQMEEEKISQAGRLKTLFVDSGSAFVAAVNDALTELGLHVIDGPHPRADLIALDATRGILVVEAKGLDGCARETNLRQAERWVADVKYGCAASEEELRADADIRNYADKLTALGISLPVGQDINIRGLMVIGTFRKVPLDKRVEADFPDPVMRVASRSAVCAITGLQLLLMILQTRKDPTFKAKFIEQLFTTSGQLALDVTWKDFLIHRGTF